MLRYNSFRVILVFVVLRTTDSARKIKDGHTVDITMNYMVYITKAQESPTFYDAWICGGAIISTLFIVTSSACVLDVQFMYAIAGYKKYVNAKDIATNECTKASRKKIVETCLPKSYDFAYDKVQKWALIDIAAVKVESPYDFSATSPLSGCSWVPGAIDINTEPKFAAPGIDAMVLGWGHTHKWRKPGDSKDYNQEILQYSPILLMEKEECKKLYAHNPDLLSIIDKWMICAMNEGNIDENGDLITISEPNEDGCIGKAVRVGGECQEPVQETLKPRPKNKRPTQRPQPNRPTQRPQPHRSTKRPQPQRSTQRPQPYRSTKRPQTYRPIQRLQPYRPTQRPQAYRPTQRPQPLDVGRFRWASNPNANPYAYIVRQQQNQGYNNWNSRGYQNYGFDPYANVNQNPSAVDYGAIPFNDIAFNLRRQDGNRTANTTSYNYTRKAGICQNDHGGPLVTWVGKHELLIGVASVFQLEKNLDCVGPYLFTTTLCNAFLSCVIVNDTKVSNLTSPLAKVHVTTPVINDTGKRAKGSKEFLHFKETPDKHKDSGFLYDTHDQDQNNGYDNIYDSYYYDSYLSDDGSSLRPPLLKETLQDPNKKDNGDETFRSFVRRSSEICNLPDDKNRFDVVQRRISWKNHPDGPAANELQEDLFERPSRPIRVL